MSRTAIIRIAASLLLLVAGITAVNLLTAWLSVKSQVEYRLASHMPETLTDSLRYSLADAQVLGMVIQQINADMASLTIRGRIPLLKECRLSLTKLDHGQQEDRTRTAANPLTAISIGWYRGDLQGRAVFAFDCRINAGTLAGLSTLLAILVLMAILLLPAAASDMQKSLQRSLLNAGFKPAESREIALLSASLDEQQKPWLELACRLCGSKGAGSQWIHDVVAASDQIVFDHHQHSVTIHGINVSLSKTPYFYYAWYASKRLRSDHDGWVLNPSSNRPDPKSAALLIDLMESFGGHQKAINELRQHGLRGKLLDQNRSKIKDELTAILGEKLAARYLFESARDTRSGRYRYRLSTPPDIIQLP
jgi:hypothetical protein